MEKVISSEMLKILLPVFGACILTLIFLLKISKMVIGGSKRLNTRRNLYLLVGALLFGIAGITGHPSIFKDPFTLLIIYQVYFLGLGIWHYYLINTLFPVSESERPTSFRLAFTLSVMLFGALLFLLVFRFVNDQPGYLVMVLGSVLFFIIPFLVYETYLRAIAVPPKTIKLWRYPVHDGGIEPDQASLKNMLIVSFTIQKKMVDPYLTTVRSRAPAGMRFGDLFYFFVNDFNEKNPEDKIQFMTVEGNAQEWTFFKKTKWYNLFTHYIDADKTIAGNKLKENDVIVCTRSSN